MSTLQAAPLCLSSGRESKAVTNVCQVATIVVESTDLEMIQNCASPTTEEQLL